MADFSTLVRKRVMLVSQLKQIENGVNADDVTSNALMIFKKQLYEFYLKHDTLMDNILGHEDVVDDVAKEEIGAFQATYISTMCKIEDKLSAFGRVASPSPAATANEFSSHSSNIRVPKLDLPTFDGTTEKWIKYRDLFQAMIHNNVKLNNMEKFQYLEMSMKIPSNQTNILEAFTPCAAEYEAAWKAVCDRYDDKRKLLAYHCSALRETKKMTCESSTEIRRIVDTFSSHLSALTKMGYNMSKSDDAFNMFIVQMVLALLDEQTLKEWRKFKADHSIAWIELHDFLVAQGRSLEEVMPTKKVAVKPVEVKSNAKSTKSFVSSNNNNNKSDVNCAMCGENHFIRSCQKFQQLAVDSRFKLVREKRLCFNCLDSSHASKACTSKNRCKMCQQLHHTLLHFDKKSETQSNGGVAQSTYKPGIVPSSPIMKPYTPFSMTKTVNESQSSQQSNVAVETKTFITGSGETLLSTAVINVKDVNGQIHRARVILDQGSQGHYMTYRLAKQLQLPLSDCCKTLRGINGVSIVRHEAEASIESRYGDYKEDVTCSIVNNITGNLPNQTTNVKHFELPGGCFLADPQFNKSAPIDMMLNIDLFYACMLGEKHRLTSGPWLIHTTFGWLVGGTLTRSKDMESPRSLLSCFTQSIHIGCDDIDKKLEQFFSIEDREPAKPTLTPEEQYFEKVFDETTTRDKNGKFIVQLPFKSNVDKLGTNLSNATRQFYSTEKSRLKNEVHNKLYVDYMKDYIETGHMKQVEPDPNEFAHYLPHHGVIKMSSTTTKVRPVFNASSKSETGISLNDVLCVGPTVQPESFDIIMRFREQPFVIVGDIKQMYRQIWVHPTHRKFQRILWRVNPNDPLLHYELCTATFGTCCAPALATCSIRKLAIEHEKTFPAASSIIKDSMYIDDLMFGVQSIEQGRSLITRIRSIFINGGMILCKLASNCSQLLEGIPEHFIESTPEDDDNHIIKTLGIRCDLKTDQFSYNFPPMKEVQLSKAAVLSQIASIYDPIGWIGPVVLKAKMFLKKLWLLNLNWCQELPEEEQQEWREFCELFTSVNNVKIDRHCLLTDANKIELHGFCDASEGAYGAVIYIRSIDQHGNVKTSLLCSKSRVSPKHQKSLAKLELCGACLLAKLIVRVLSILQIPIDDVTLWCDSTIVLCWISMMTSKLQTFVANRVSVIQELTHQFSWRHIKGLDNPADPISRGLFPQEIEHCLLWLYGPAFFKLPKSQWPESIITINEDDPDVVQEMKKSFVAVKTDSTFELIETYSKPLRLTKVFAYVNRFRYNAKKDVVRRSGPISVDELEEASHTIIKVLQMQLFPSEYEVLSKQLEWKKRQEDKSKLLDVQQQNDDDEKLNKPNFVILDEEVESMPQISPKSTIISLRPLMDDRGFITVGGRVDASPQLTIYQKHQIILPYCRYTKAIIRSLHLKHHHPGPNAMLSIVRQEYWPIRAKTIIRKVIYECVRCFRVKPTSFNQIMAPLPAARVTMKPPFTSTAIDYAGYYNIKASVLRSNTTTKAYIALFKCMCTGAIHLELVSDLSARTFIAALVRFVSRRGLCSEIYCDNGTCFHGADNELKKIVDGNQNVVEDHCVNNHIRWIFTTPRASHAGGIYESGIKSIKHHLKRVIDDELYTFEQFSTILCKVEAVVNSRPITPMSDDPTDLQVLTPGHFLVFRPLIAVPEKNYENIPMNRLSKWEGLQKIQQEFWRMWYHDYLHTLQSRPKKFQVEVKFAIGDMVLVKDSNLPPMKWMIGRIIEMFPGRDKVVRNVAVLTPTGRKERHINYLCRLPLEDPATF